MGINSSVELHHEESNFNVFPANKRTDEDKRLMLLAELARPLDGGIWSHTSSAEKIKHLKLIIKIAVKLRAFLDITSRVDCPWWSTTLIEQKLFNIMSLKS